MKTHLKLIVFALSVFFLATISQAVPLDEVIEGDFVVRIKTTTSAEAILGFHLSRRYTPEGSKLNYFLLDGTRARGLKDVPADLCIGYYNMRGNLFYANIIYCMQSGALSNPQALQIRLPKEIQYEDIMVSPVPAGKYFNTFRDLERYRAATTVFPYNENPTSSQIQSVRSLLHLAEDAVTKGNAGLDYMMGERNHLKYIIDRKNLSKDGIFGDTPETTMARLSLQIPVGLEGSIFGQSFPAVLQPMTKLLLNQRLTARADNNVSSWEDDLGLLLESYAQRFYVPMEPILTTKDGKTQPLETLLPPNSTDDSRYYEAWFKCGTGSMNMRFEDKRCNRFSINNKVFRRAMPITNLCLREAYKIATGKAFPPETPIDVLHLGTYRRSNSSHYSSENLDLYGVRFGKDKFNYFQSNIELVRALEAFIKSKRPNETELDYETLQDLSEEFFKINSESSTLEAFNYWVPFEKCVASFNMNYVNWGDIGTFAPANDMTSIDGEPSNIVFKKGTRPKHYLKTVHPEWLGSRANTGHVNHIHLWFEDFRDSE